MRVILYGDSMTEYLHQPPRVLAEHLQQLQPSVSYEFFNWAIGGTRAELVLYRLMYEFWHGRARMLPLTQSRPDILVLESCAFNNANDREEGLSNFHHIWDQILAVCRRHAPQARIITYLTIAGCPIVPEEKANRLFFRAAPEVFTYRHKWREIYQQAFVQWVQDNGVEFVNVREEVLRRESQGVPRTHWISADGVHPNPEGVALISELIAHGVAAAGERPL
ncbi:MAG: SGNH/GDSL hydrolase family protein [Phycisphaerae bacterium]